MVLRSRFRKTGNRAISFFGELENPNPYAGILPACTRMILKTYLKK